jgi:hypothetical protein
VLVVLLAALWCPGAQATPVAGPAAGKGRVYLTVDEALELAFPKATIERETSYLTKLQMKQARKLAGVKIASPIVHPYIVLDDKGKPLAYAYFDTHKVRTLRETLMIVVDTRSRVQRLEILAFGEPTEYIPRGNWYGQFLGKKLGPNLNLKRHIRGVTGASLTARATTSAVRRTLALHRVLHGPPISDTQVASIGKSGK